MSDYFIFDDIDTRNYEDILVYFNEVDTTPKRVGESIQIPNRNGSFFLDGGRYEDTTQTYDIVALSKEYASDLINALASKVGYCRLEDSFNPDEFYSAVFNSEIEPKITKERDKLTFKVTFTRKPQRWLKSGEEKKTIGEWHDIVSASGSIIEFENNSNLEIKSAILTINPVQEGAGTPSPSNPRPFKPQGGVVISVGGKNLIISSDCTNRTESGITTTRNTNGSIHLSGTAESTERWWSATDNLNRILKAGTYTLSPSNLELYTIDGYKSGTFTIENDSIINNARFILTNGAEYDEVVYPQLELGTEATEYESRFVTGYGLTTVSNIYGMVCDFAGDGTSYPAYTTVGHIDSYAGEEIGEPWWSSIDEYVSGTTPSTGAEVVYTLETPTVSYLSALSLPKTRSGINVIFAPAQNATIEIEYGEDANSLVNPTLFKSSPLLEVKGGGTIIFNDSTSWEYDIVLTDREIGYIVLAQEMEFTASGKAETLAGGVMNVGDTITVAPSKLYWAGTLRANQRVGTVTIDSITDSVTGVTTTSAGRTGSATWDFYTNIPALTFSALSATETWQNVTTLTGTYQYITGSGSGQTITTRNYELTMITKIVRSTASSIADRISITRTTGGSRPTGSTFSYTYMPSTVGEVTGNSTKSVLGNPTYIDLDIGEAYKIQTNPLVYISLNEFLDLGSDLPTFKTGRNKITTSDTITELVITPRWWKV